MPPPDDTSTRIIPFYSLRLGDLVSARAEILCWCGACRKERRVGVIPVLAKFGPGHGVRELEKTFTCPHCKRTGFGSVRVEWL